MTDPKRLYKDGPGDPVHRQENREVNRRGFIGMLTVLTAGLAAASVPAVGLLRSEEGSDGADPLVKVAHVDEIPVGGAVNFAYPDAHHPAILIRLETGELRAYNNRCTHLECPVYYVKGENRLRCPCHEGEFDVASGKPTAGPPKRQLTGIRLSVVDGVVYAVGRYGSA